MAEEDTRTLAELLASGPMEYHRFLRYAGQLASELERLHGSGRAHGEINPTSILLSSLDEIALRPSAVAKENSPENVRDDLYQTGLVFTQMLAATGSGNAERPIHPIVSEHAPLESATALIPVEARLLLEELLAPDPKERIQTARELSSTIRELVDLSRMPVEPSLPERRDRSRLYFVAAMTILIALVVWVVLEIVHKI